jgi:hypothetical protein
VYSGPGYPLSILSMVDMIVIESVFLYCLNNDKLHVVNYVKISPEGELVLAV